MKEHIKLFNLKNVQGQNKFKILTSKPGILSDIIKNGNGDINSVTKKFIKRLNGCLHECFQKIRVTNLENKEITKLFKKRRSLRTKLDKESKKELRKTDEKLAELCAEEIFHKINDEIKGLESEKGGLNAGRLWKLKKRLSPRAEDPPTAMMDNEGNLVTTESGIKKLASEHYKKVLENRPMKEELKHVQSDKEELAALRLNIAKTNKSPPWDAEDLETVLKNLKNNKARDPLGNANEIFKPTAAGSDLKLAILLLVNMIKDKLELPDVFRMCNITSIFKKGKRSEFTNYRGIFRVIIFRSILDRLVYNDIYPDIDSNLSDANVGSRKERNVRDNLFVLYAVLNSIKRGGEEACDIGVYDVIKCFDSLWSQECINDLWDAGCKDDKLKILALGNEYANVAVKTSGGMTSRENIPNIIMQGTVNAGLFCTSTMDKLAKSVYKDQTLVYKYKGVSDVPPLEIVNDVLTISKCSITSLTMNVVVNSFMENKKLKLSSEKCSVIYVGKAKNKC